MQADVCKEILFFLLCRNVYVHIFDVSSFLYSARILLHRPAMRKPEVRQDHRARVTALNDEHDAEIRRHPSLAASTKEWPPVQGCRGEGVLTPNFRRSVLGCVEAGCCN